MAIGNSKSEGSKGSNHSFQSRNLKLLSQILASSGGGATVETAGALDITGTSGSTSATYKSVTFVCAEGEVTIAGQVFPAGTYSFNNPNGTLTPILYDATASTNCKILFQK
jgi:hypothetical protein